MFTNLLIVVAAGLLAPLALGFFPRVRLPAIVLEIVLGIVIGPSGVGWVKPDAPVSILALIGLAFLLFLSGLEIDPERLRGRIVKLAALGFAVSFAIAILIGIGLRAGGFVRSPLFIAIVLVATSLGVVFPVLKDSGNIDSSLGELVIAAASIADFGSIILLSLFFSGKSSTSTAGRLILLGIFGLVVVAVGVAIASAERSMNLSRVLRRLQDTTAQIRVRAAFLLLIGFTALAESVGLETILGAFAAGALLSLLDRDEATTHPQFRLKLEAVGFGVFIPIFFVTSGVTFDLSALFASGSTIARVPLFLLAILLARPPRAGLPASAWPLARVDRGHPAGHVAPVHRGRDPDRPSARHRLPRQRRGPGGRRAAVRRDLPGARARPAPPRAPGNRHPPRGADSHNARAHHRRPRAPSRERRQAGGMRRPAAAGARAGTVSRITPARPAWTCSRRQGS